MYSGNKALSDAKFLPARKGNDPGTTNEVAAQEIMYRLPLGSIYNGVKWQGVIFIYDGQIDVVLSQAAKTVIYCFYGSRIN